MANNIFEIKDLSFLYGNNKVIDGLNLKIKEGKITTLIGANGCGKSTLFNLMTKNIKPDNGIIFLGGQNIEQMKLKDFARKTAIVHQYNTAPPDITVKKLVEFGRTPYHTLGLSPNPEEDRKKVRFALEITNTKKFEDKPVSQLSGGQKQRVWIAMALAQDTKILFLDEPTTYLDIRYQLQILRLVKRLNSEFNITVIMVLHDINQSLCYSDEIVAMQNGKILSQGIPKEIITPKLIEDVYGVTLETGEIDGKPFVIPV